MAIGLDELRKYYNSCEFIRNEGLVCEEIGEGRSRWSCEVTDSFCNPYGIAHGGFLFSIMDTAACATAAFSGDSVRMCVTLSGNVHYTRPAYKGKLTITGELKKAGKSTGLSIAEIHDPEGNLCAYAAFEVFFKD